MHTLDAFLDFQPITWISIKCNIASHFVFISTLKQIQYLFIPKNKNKAANKHAHRQSYMYRHSYHLCSAGFNIAIFKIGQPSCFVDAF